MPLARTPPFGCCHVNPKLAVITLDVGMQCLTTPTDLYKWHMVPWLPLCKLFFIWEMFAVWPKWYQMIFESLGPLKSLEKNPSNQDPAVTLRIPFGKLQASPIFTACSRAEALKSMIRFLWALLESHGHQSMWAQKTDISSKVGWIQVMFISNCCIKRFRNVQKRFNSPILTWNWPSKFGTQSGVPSAKFTPKRSTPSSLRSATFWRAQPLGIGAGGLTRDSDFRPKLTRQSGEESSSSSSSSSSIIQWLSLTTC